MNDESPEEQKPSVDDALMDPGLIPFSHIRSGDYPHHAVLRPQWLTSFSKYPFWFHDTGQWLWMTRPLQYAGEIASPEMQWEEFVEQSDVSAEPAAGSTVPINPPGEIYVTANTVPQPTPVGMFPTVKEAMAAFEKYWLEHRSRIWETGHLHPEVTLEAPDWRRGSGARNLQYPLANPMRGSIEAWLLNMQTLGKPIIRTRFGSFIIYKPEAVSFLENYEYPGGQLLRLSDKNATSS